MIKELENPKTKLIRKSNIINQLEKEKAELEKPKLAMENYKQLIKEIEEL